MDLEYAHVHCFVVQLRKKQYPPSDKKKVISYLIASMLRVVTYMHGFL